MKRLFTSLFIILSNIGYSQKSNHIVLISIDGFRPEMYLNKDRSTPNLQWLMKQGVYAKHMKSVFPAYTYPSHTAMMTGALPARNGIYFNQPKTLRQAQGSSSNSGWNWFTDSIKVPTLWQVLKKEGKVTASVEWPCSVTKDITYDVPEIWNVKTPEDRISEARKYATPGLIEEIEKNATGKLDSNNFRDECFCLDENAGRIAAYIFKTYKPNFLALHFAEVDGMEHEYGINADSVKLAIAADDRAIGDVLQAIEDNGLKDSTTVIIVGDHGFADIHEVFRVNMLIKDVPARFIAAGGSAFLYTALQPSRISGTGSKGGVKEGSLTNEAITKAVKEKLNALPKEKRKLFRIIDRKELDEMGADSSALLALAAKPGLVFSSSTSSAQVANNGPGTLIQQNPLEGIFIPTHGGHHGYDPNIPEMWTGFIAAGAGINKGKVIDELCVTDIAPLIAKLLGIDFKCPDGKLVEGVIKN